MPGRESELMKRKVRQVLPVIIYLALLALTLALVLRFGGTPEKEVEKIGFITVDDASGTGWSAIHYQGIQKACESLGVELVAKLRVSEEDDSSLGAIEELAEAGVGMIILNSNGYTERIGEHLADYPGIAFYSTNPAQNAPNLTTYSSRMYQARYLSGIVAGMQTKTGKIGFVAADKMTEVYRGINAFALGVQRVNPEAEVIVSWTSSMTDKEGGQRMAKELIEQEGVDVITYHQHQPDVIDVAEEEGIFSIGYYEPVKDASDKYLTCAMCDWEPLYVSLIEEYLKGQANTTEYDWLGLREGVLLLTEYSPLVSEETKEQVEKARQEILSGFDVFSREIIDNQGKVRCAEGEAISDDTLMYNMDWLAEGVREYEG